MSRYVARRRIELGLKQIEVAVPQIHEPGAEAAVDFGEFWTHIDRGLGYGSSRYTNDTGTTKIRAVDLRYSDGFRVARAGGSRCHGGVLIPAPYIGS